MSILIYYTFVYCSLDTDYSFSGKTLREHLQLVKISQGYNIDKVDIFKLLIPKNNNSPLHVTFVPFVDVCPFLLQFAMVQESLFQKLALIEQILSVSQSQSNISEEGITSISFIILKS